MKSVKLMLFFVLVARLSLRNLRAGIRRRRLGQAVTLGDSYSCLATRPPPAADSLARAAVGSVGSEQWRQHNEP